MLIDDEGCAVLTDFGLAFKLDGEATGFTSSDFSGSLRFLPPELLDSVEKSTSTDVYALGCTCMQV